MYKIITCDLDETLLSMDRSICRRNIEAIHAAAEKGVKFVCASGRGYMSFQNTLQEIGLYDLADQYSISFNGGAITENRETVSCILRAFPGNWRTPSTGKAGNMMSVSTSIHRIRSICTTAMRMKWIFSITGRISLKFMTRTCPF